MRRKVRHTLASLRAAVLPLAAALAVAACGGGGGSAGGARGAATGLAAEAMALAEGFPDEGGIAAEDFGFGGRSLAPDFSMAAAGAFLAASAPAPADVESDAWVTWPESLAQNVTDANNLYTGDDQRLRWPGVDGATQYENRSNCAGFVTRSLKQAFALDDAYFRGWMDSTGPSSARYHDNIVAQNRFVQVTRIEDIRRGDIVAIKYIDAGSGGTGHTMVAQRPASLRAVATRPLVADTVQYELRVIDSTSSPHGAGDTRKGTGPNGSDQDGAGFGTVRLYARPDGTLAGYTWSLSTGSSYYTATSPASDRRSMVFGRLALP